eukprot:NODE_302_length_2489_cov_21.568033_g279_i0.p1 GENE.NODE_302_length_2489_cov_21.568033_g279_i0~~NODE_302_length_2489_cov_21.568033_g279_i0.p1  ORF type:complete len:649 (+),score=134.92 NODE_302_length_2489_cov_21.568033_g279_i0:200-2146(+)
MARSPKRAGEHQSSHRGQSPPLPYGWSKRQNEEGLTYYVDHVKKVTQWNDPREERGSRDDRRLSRSPRRSPRLSPRRSSPPRKRRRSPSPESSRHSRHLREYSPEYRQRSRSRRRDGRRHRKDSPPRMRRRSGSRGMRRRSRSPPPMLLPRLLPRKAPVRSDGLLLHPYVQAQLDDLCKNRLLERSDLDESTLEKLAELEDGAGAIVMEAFSQANHDAVGDKARLLRNMIRGYRDGRWAGKDIYCQRIAREGKAQFLSPDVQAKLDHAFRKRILSRAELDQDVLQRLSECTPSEGCEILDTFLQQDFMKIQNKAAFLMGIVKRTRLQRENVDNAVATSPDERRSAVRPRRAADNPPPARKPRVVDCTVESADLAPQSDAGKEESSGEGAGVFTATRASSGDSHQEGTGEILHHEDREASDAEGTADAMESEAIVEGGNVRTDVEGAAHEASEVGAAAPLEDAAERIEGNEAHSTANESVPEGNVLGAAQVVAVEPEAEDVGQSAAEDTEEGEIENAEKTAAELNCGVEGETAEMTLDEDSVGKLCAEEASCNHGMSEDNGHSETAAASDASSNSEDQPADDPVEAQMMQLPLSTEFATATATANAGTTTTTTTTTTTIAGDPETEPQPEEPNIRVLEDDVPVEQQASQ